MRKQHQANTMCIHEEMSNVQTPTKFVKDYWENDFEKVLDCARTIVFYLGIDQVFVEKNNKRRIKKIHFDESGDGSSEWLHELSPPKLSKIQYYVYIVDQTIGTLEQGFEK